MTKHIPPRPASRRPTSSPALRTVNNHDALRQKIKAQMEQPIMTDPRPRVKLLQCYLGHIATGLAVAVSEATAAEISDCSFSSDLLRSTNPRDLFNQQTGCYETHGTLHLGGAVYKALLLSPALPVKLRTRYNAEDVLPGTVDIIQLDPVKEFIDEGGTVSHAPDKERPTYYVACKESRSRCEFADPTTWLVEADCHQRLNPPVTFIDFMKMHDPHLPPPVNYDFPRIMSTVHPIHTQGARPRPNAKVFKIAGGTDIK